MFLGNLFDDSKTASLTEAMQTDTFQAAGETIDLGVAAVQDGGLDVDVSLSEGGVRFSLENVGGGGPRVKGLPANDTYRSCSTVAIRTTGADFNADECTFKVEEGIGMSTNELLTFDLDEIRNSGRLGGRTLRFVADRVGMNDREPESTVSRGLASARFVVLVSTADTVLGGYVDGKQYPVLKRGDVSMFDLTGTSNCRDHSAATVEFVSFNVPLPANAKFLTLATTMCDVEHDDHAVFSGARLEIGPQETPGSLASLLQTQQTRLLAVSRAIQQGCHRIMTGVRRSFFARLQAAGATRLSRIASDLSLAHDRDRDCSRVEAADSRSPHQAAFRS